jgi:serine/threonine-protein kinase RsbT
VPGRLDQAPFNHVPAGERPVVSRIKEATTLPLRDEDDIRTALDLGRTMAGKVGFERADWTRLETIIMALSFGALRYGDGGTITLRCVERTRTGIAAGGLPTDLQPGLEIVVMDRAPCAIDLAQVLAERCDTPGVNLGISFLCQLADELEVHSNAGLGLYVRACKWARFREELLKENVG